MRQPLELTLTHHAWEEISRHAVDSFPEECCGVILSNGIVDEVRRLRNIQNQLHAVDRKSYPRDATTAYNIDPRELEPILHEGKIAGGTLKAFYHSHPNHEAYFSAEDRESATPFGEPTYPDCAQIVISIYDRTVRRICAYAWSDDKKEFVEVPLRII